jgi:hypothetical protein
MNNLLQQLRGLFSRPEQGHSFGGGSSGGYGQSGSWGGPEVLGETQEQAPKIDPRLLDEEYIHNLHRISPESETAWMEMGQAPVARENLTQYGEPYQPIFDYALNYGGSRFTPAILGLLAGRMDPQTLAMAIAASVQETSMGAKASNFRGGLKDRNWFGLHIGGNQYDPENWDIMADDIIRNFGEGGRFEPKNFTREKVDTFTAGDKSEDWMRNVPIALNNMGYGHLWPM